MPPKNIARDSRDTRADPPTGSKTNLGHPMVPTGSFKKAIDILADCFFLFYIMHHLNPLNLLELALVFVVLDKNSRTLLDLQPSGTPIWTI